MEDKINEIFNDVGNWGARIAIHPINAVPMSCSGITTVSHASLMEMSLDAFEGMISKMCSYNIYVKSQKSSIEAQVEVVQSEFNKALYLETNNLGAEYKYKNIEEKIAIVRTIKPEIDAMSVRLTTLKAKFIRIKDIPFAIDKKIDILRTIYSRRASNEQSSKHQQ